MGGRRPFGRGACRSKGGRCGRCVGCAVIVRIRMTVLMDRCVRVDLQVQRVGVWQSDESGGQRAAVSRCRQSGGSEAQSDAEPLARLPLRGCAFTLTVALVSLVSQLGEVDEGRAENGAAAGAPLADQPHGRRRGQQHGLRGRR